MGSCRDVKHNLVFPIQLVEHWTYNSDIGQMRSSHRRMIRHEDISRTKFAPVKVGLAPDGVLHTAKMYWHMWRIGDQGSISGENGAGKVEPFFDLQADCAFLQDSSHLLGDGHKPGVSEGDWVDSPIAKDRQSYGVHGRYVELCTRAKPDIDKDNVGQDGGLVFREHDYRLSVVQNEGRAFDHGAGSQVTKSIAGTVNVCLGLVKVDLGRDSRGWRGERGLSQGLKLVGPLGGFDRLATANSGYANV